MEEVAEVLRPENFEKRRGKAAGIAEGVAEMRTMSMDASTPGVKDLKMEGVHVKHKYAGPMECNIVVHYGGESACRCPDILVPIAWGEVWVGCIATAETFRRSTQPAWRVPACSALPAQAWAATSCSPSTSSAPPSRCPWWLLTRRARCAHQDCKIYHYLPGQRNEIIACSLPPVDCGQLEALFSVC